MKMPFRAMTAAAVLMAAACPAATMTGSGTRDTLFESTDLSRWSVGIDYEMMKRDVTSDRREDDRLTVEDYGIYVGYRPIGWLTLQGTIFVPETEISERTYNDGNIGWSLGLQANLWRYDMADPEFMSGRYSLRAGMDYRRAGFDDEDVEGDWQEFSTGLWLHYEMFADDMAHTDKHPYSLSLFAGPLLSILNGSADGGMGAGDFDERENLGLGGGVDLAVSHNFIASMTVEYFDHISYLWSARYRF